jgi:hypothetical protein
MNVEHIHAPSLNKGLNIEQNIIRQLGPLRITPPPLQGELAKRSKIGFINLRHWTNLEELISSVLSAVPLDVSQASKAIWTPESVTRDACSRWAAA